MKYVWDDEAWGVKVEFDHQKDLDTVWEHLKPVDDNGHKLAKVTRRTYFRAAEYHQNNSICLIRPYSQYSEKTWSYAVQPLTLLFICKDFPDSATECEKQVRWFVEKKLNPEAAKRKTKHHDNLNNDGHSSTSLRSGDNQRRSGSNVEVNVERSKSRPSHDTLTHPRPASSLTHETPNGHLDNSQVNVKRRKVDNAIPDVSCKQCNRVLKKDAKFCDLCGNKVPLSCKSCFRLLKEDAKFCDSCGVPVNRCADSDYPSSFVTPPSSPQVTASTGA